MADQIQIRRDTAANWTSADPTLAQGELGVETDTNKMKVGNGSTAWSSLSYLIDTGGYAAYADATANFTGDLQKSGVSVPAYGDTTANFTGTLQQGGSNVVLDSDIGSTVQAHDANLTSFIGAVNLPTSDGSASQVLQTDGSGAVTFADAASGGGVSYDPTVGSETFIPTPGNAYGALLGITHYNSYATSSSYAGAARGRDGSASNQAKSNRFLVWSAFRSDAHAQSVGVYRGGLIQTSFSVVPSTGVVTWTTAGNDWQEVWMNNTYSGSPNSTQQFFTIPGSGQIHMNGNIVHTGQSSHQFSCVEWGTDTSGVFQNTSSQVGSGIGLHGENGVRLALPINDSANGYSANTGYDASNSKGSYRIYNINSTVYAPSNAGLSQCLNTTSSTCSKVNMVDQPGIPYPDATHDYPVDMWFYNVSGQWSCQTVNYAGTVSGEINSGFNREFYTYIAFKLMDSDGSSPCVMMYDTQKWSPSKWSAYNVAPTDYTANTQTGSQYYPQYGPSYGGMGGFVATGVQNEFICFHYADQPTYQNGYTPIGLQRFKIDPATGKFTDMYHCPIGRTTKGWNSRVSDSHYMYGLYGDDGNSSTVTHLCVIRNDHSSGRGRWAAQVIGLPAASDWIEIVLG